MSYTVILSVDFGFVKSCIKCENFFEFPSHYFQIENEYGSYFACDYAYGEHLRDRVKNALGDDVVIYTTDGCNLRDQYCGKVKHVYASVDFGADRKLS